MVEELNADQASLEELRLLVGEKNESLETEMNTFTHLLTPTQVLEPPLAF